MLNAALYTVPMLFALLPNWLAGALLPALLVGQRLLIGEEEKLSVGPIGIYPLDILSVLLIVKWLAGGGLARLAGMDRGVLQALGAWILVNFFATLLAGVKFGEAHTMSCLVSLARGLADTMLVIIVGDAIRSPRQARLAVMMILLFLGGLIAIQFINFAGASRGFVIGEVQGLERDEPRIFGPVGDSVGFVLLLGYLLGLCRDNLIVAGAFAGGILLTAGLGAVLGMTIATGLYLLAPPSGAVTMTRSLRGPRLLLGLAAVGVAALFYAEPITETLRQRFDGNHEESAEQRVATSKVARAMIDDNLLTGVGFMGFRLVIDRYGGGDYFDLDRPDGATANANNQALQSLTDAGLAGLLCLAALVFAGARLLHRVANQTSDALLASFCWACMLWLLSQALGNLAATWLTPGSFVALLLWISLGIASAVQRLAVGVEVETSTDAESKRWEEAIEPTLV